ncbi:MULTISPECIES: TRAP transporter large permease [Shewanella]|uniref:TRAP transporter large permease protein n=1 Tax=Shewanella nanhaiensis TaxID=2864872 RepID=A0ABS7E3E9_9GAMM|nr:MULTISPECIES: TRAP transporter large permease subunit [Shewanella]MBW8184207.1 TRAP transporter large permease subunit [Shewanella nanhaiensis]
MTGLALFIIAMIAIFFGFPIAFTFAGVSMAIGILVLGIDLFAFMPFRIMSTMQNTILMAVPLFIFMGIVLQKTNLAEELLESMGKLFGGLKGGLAISTIIVGLFLAASTGVVGASVVAMGVISLPVMLKHRYDPKLATGIICAAGTLGQIVPPSIILIILGDVMGLPVGDLFTAALLPSLILVSAYLIYILAIVNIKPSIAPPIKNELDEPNLTMVIKCLKLIIPPLFLIVAVLGSIYSGLATPTESSALGGVGALLLALIYGKFKFKLLFDSALETVKVSSMVFAVLIGATAFSMVFSYSGGESIVEEFFVSLPNAQWTFVLIAMLTIFILGFFIDFIEIAFIIVPILTPIALSLGLNMNWLAILIAMNLQTSFLTPPFGFSLFYLKGVAPPQIKTLAIYKGVLPFIAIQMLILALLVFFPELFGLSRLS